MCYLRRGGAASRRQPPAASPEPQPDSSILQLFPAKKKVCPEICEAAMEPPVSCSYFLPRKKFVQRHARPQWSHTQLGNSLVTQATTCLLRWLQPPWASRGCSGAALATGPAVLSLASLVCRFHFFSCLLCHRISSSFCCLWLGTSAPTPLQGKEKLLLTQNQPQEELPGDQSFEINLIQLLFCGVCALLKFDSIIIKSNKNKPPVPILYFVSWSSYRRHHQYQIDIVAASHCRPSQGRHTREYYC